MEKEDREYFQESSCTEHGREMNTNKSKHIIMSAPKQTTEMRDTAKHIYMYYNEGTSHHNILYCFGDSKKSYMHIIMYLMWDEDNE